MTTLRERAEVAFAEITKCTCHDDYKLRDRTDPTCIACEIGNEVKDAIAAEARAFAERALREYTKRQVFIGDERTHRIAAAIAAAEADDE